CPEAPPALIEVCERMLAKDPPARPPTGEAVGAALQALGELLVGPPRPLRRDATPTLAVPAPATLTTAVLVAIEPPMSDRSVAAVEAAAEVAARLRGRLEILEDGSIVVALAGNN